MNEYSNDPAVSRNMDLLSINTIRTLSMDAVQAADSGHPGTPMAMREVMRLRFLENWEYHEIAAAQKVPIGTVQWRVFNAKKKLVSHLAARPERSWKAA